jgi:cathepsin B
MVWNFMESQGITTESCYPYVSGTGIEPACQTKCKDNSDFPGRHKCASKSVHPTTATNIKNEIYNNGPAELAFTVYQDFMNYESGVYWHTTGSQLGGHAVTLVGYGTENGVEYWLCANSWSPRWGDSGFFKIKQGDSGSNGQIYTCPFAAPSSTQESF